MGSTSISNPTDNRLAVTDQAFGMTTSVSGNNSAVGYAPNSGIRNARDVSYLSPFAKQLSGSNNTLTEAGGVNLAGASAKGNLGFSWTNNTVTNTLDGGAVNRAFDFAENSMSRLLGSLVDGQKQSTALSVAAGNEQAKSIAAALNKSAETQGSFTGALSDLGRSISDALGFSSAATAYQAQQGAAANEAIAGALYANAQATNAGLQNSQSMVQGMFEAFKQAGQPTASQQATGPQAAGSGGGMKTVLVLALIGGGAWWFLKGRK